MLQERYEKNAIFKNYGLVQGEKLNILGNQNEKERTWEIVRLWKH